MKGVGLRLKELYCITCPTGCKLSVSDTSGEFVVEGNECKRGVDFAKAEMTKPTRSLTTTVRTSLPGVPVLPVRTDGEIPKEKIMEAMRVLNNVIVSSELDCGDTVLENVAGCGVRVIATSDILHRNAGCTIRNREVQSEDNIGSEENVGSCVNTRHAGSKASEESYRDKEGDESQQSTDGDCENEADLQGDTTTPTAKGDKSNKFRVTPLRT